MKPSKYKISFQLCLKVSRFGEICTDDNQCIPMGPGAYCGADRHCQCKEHYESFADNGLALCRRIVCKYKLNEGWHLYISSQIFWRCWLHVPFSDPFSHFASQIFLDSLPFKFCNTVSNPLRPLYDLKKPPIPQT